MKRYQILYKKPVSRSAFGSRLRRMLAALQTGFGLLVTPSMCGNTRRPAHEKPTSNPA